MLLGTSLLIFAQDYPFSVVKSGTGKQAVIFIPGFACSGESVATYDFSDDLRRFQWGIQFGGEWKAFKHLNVYADLTWGLNDIFKKNFDTISFAMYPIYLNVGFGYSF